MRLTEKDDLGHWFLKGLEWGQLREGKVITKAVAQKLYGYYVDDPERFM